MPVDAAAASAGAGATRRRAVAGHFVYIVRCADGSLYTGYARDPEARVAAHNAGKGAKYTAGRRPVALVYLEAKRTRSRALKREHALKRLPRAAKLALIARLGRPPRASSRDRSVRPGPRAGR
jgi:putative endonuclease